MRKFASILTTGIVALALTACGGSSGDGMLTGGSSGSGSGSGTGTGTGTGTTSATVAGLSIASSSATVSPDGTSTATITVTAKSSSNVAVSGATVNFSSTAGTLAVSSATTGATGQATATLSGQGVAVGTKITVTASVGNVSTTTVISVASSSGTASASGLSLSSSVPTIPADGSANATITALARNNNNNLIAGVQICFSSTSGGLVVANGNNGCVTSDVNGSATATLSTAGNSTLQTITVTASTGSLNATTKVQVVPAVSNTTLQLGNTGVTGAATFTAGQIALSSGSGNISNGGTTTLAVAIEDQNGNLYTSSAVPIRFSSTCLANGNASIAAAQGGTVTGNTGTTSTGFLSVTYTNIACSGTDAITATATVNSTAYTAAGTVTDQAASLGSIQFQSASQTSIGLKGTGLNETSVLTFKVLNSTGGPYQGANVSFALNTVVGGVALSPLTAVSGSDGTVQTTVSSGTVHTTVRVTASITTPASLSTQSSQLTITTGLPTSNAFGIAVGKASLGGMACPNIESYSQDGVTAPITAYLSDRYNNPVPNGTAVAFTTDAGQIVGNCNTMGGNCNVTWTSANPRPNSNSITSTSPAIVAGRGMILATTIGEEAFADANGNGYYDPLETFSDLGEPYRDDNEDNSHESGEYFLDFNNNGMRDPPSGSFIGITCTSTTCTQNTLAIGASLEITMSTSLANISVDTADSVGVTFGGGNPSVPVGGGTLVFNVKDLNGNSMGAGTTVSVTSSNGSKLAAAMANSGANVVGCNAGTSGDNFGVNLSNGVSGNTVVVTLTVTSPSGSATSFGVPVSVQ